VQPLELLILCATALLTLIAVVGIIMVLRRLRGQRQLRETLARVLHDVDSSESPDSRHEATERGPAADGDREPDAHTRSRGRDGGDP
jgi:hypothetical protein